MFDRLRCPGCGGELDIVRTAYGERAACFHPCDVRWTRIVGEREWTRERR